MAGGTSIWRSKDAKTDPRAIFNPRLLYLLVTLAWAGCLYGFDSGNIGGILTLPSFEHAFGLSELSQTEMDKRKGTIAAMLAAGGSAGALCAWPTADFLGRKWSVFLWGLIFLIGAVMQMVADYDVLLAGRFIGGMGVGASSMLSPQFLAENSPKSVRGSMTATYNLMIILSLMLAFWVNYGVSLWSYQGVEHDSKQWRVAMGIQLIPGALMCLMIPFIPETPRYLINHGKAQQRLRNLIKLRKLPVEHPYIQTEYQEIEAQVRCEQEAHQGHSVWVVIQDIFTNKSNFQRFFLATMLFLFHKFTGTDSLNYYAPRIFELIGVSGGSNALLTTGVYGIVKFVTTIFYVGFLVDRIGRRLPLLVGATLQATAMLYVALYIRFAGDKTSDDSSSGPSPGGIVGIIWIYVYAFGWSFGHSVACYVVAAEIFPTRIRSICMAFCFFINWIVDYGITKATPLMLTEMGWGTFLLYAILRCRRDLWTMWRHAYPTEEEKVRHDVQELMLATRPEKVNDDDLEKMGDDAIHVEKAEA
ncbi:hypothetical protein B0A50_01504 [Salinomyces thailandicus]|uniref:Major facilitator superfamily (MFS) profile domain-containing protein n=1 Tax=Salinomyces thailandicus TaxID=706561 RepID=A0A4U0UAS1_9PEZI|nr:hypothetical protein B0A50_01504 [Salinomyces thailandica]